jgi:hypothetical protein
MSLGWRWVVGVVVATAVVGSFLPNAVISGNYAASRPLAHLAGETPGWPTGCGATSCNKGTVPPAIPANTAAAMCADMTEAITCVDSPTTKRLQHGARPLPRGIGSVLFHPPQFI